MNRYITKTIDIDVDLTPEELARLFLLMDSAEQAQFFSCADKIVKDDWELPFCFQLQSITDEESLTDGGRYIMEQIGEYSSHTPTEEG